MSQYKATLTLQCQATCVTRIMENLLKKTGQLLNQRNIWYV